LIRVQTALAQPSNQKGKATITRLKKSRKRRLITYNASSAQRWGTMHQCALLSLKARRKGKLNLGKGYATNVSNMDTSLRLVHK
jgi:hypothetical protein